MEKIINPLGILLACVAIPLLVGVILGAKQHFFGFITIGGLAYALLTEKDDKKPTIH